MRNLFSPRLNVVQDQLITSSAVVMPDIPLGSFARIVDSDTPGNFIKNGAFAGPQCAIRKGDSLQIQVRSSVDPATPLFIAYNIYGEDGIFTVCTQSPNTPIQLVGFNGLIPLDLTLSQGAASQDFSPDVSSTSSVYDITDGSYVTAYAVPTTLGDQPGSQGLATANYYSGMVMQQSAIGEYIGGTEVGAQPYALAYTTGLMWVTVSSQNHVVAIDTNNEIVHTFPTGARPMGIASFKGAQNKWHVLVANYNSGTLTHLTQNGASWTSATLTLGPKPFEIAIDALGYAWVTSTQNFMWRVNVLTGTWTTFALGAANVGPRGVVHNGFDNHVYVSCSTSNTVARIDPNSLAVTSIQTALTPYGISVGDDGKTYVACFSSALVQSITNGAVDQTYSVDAYPYAVHAYQGNLFVTNYYGLPSVIADRTSLGFGIIDPPQVPQRTLIGTSSFKVSGIDTPVPCAVPNIFGATIFKNGTEVGQRTLVTSGDELSFVITTPFIELVNIDIPIFVGNVYDSFHTQTSVEDVMPDFTDFFFPDTTEVANNILVRSKVFTIASIDPAVVLQFTTTRGTIIKNGVDQLSTVVDVHVGDQIQVEVRSSVTKNLRIDTTLSLAGMYATWRVATKLVPTYWIKQQYKGIGELDKEFVPNISAELIHLDNDGNLLGTYNMHATPDGDTTRNVFYLFVPSMYEDCLYRIKADGTVAGRVDFYAGYKPFAVCSSPKLSHSWNQLARQFVTLLGTKSVQELESGHPIIYFNEEPRSIAAADDGSRLYVTIPDSGDVAVLKNDGFLGPYSTSHLVHVGGEPYDVVVWGKKAIVSDRKTNVLSVINIDTLTTTKYYAGVGVWDMQLDGNQLWTANSYDNTITRIDLATGGAQTFPAGSVPNGISIDKATHRVLVSHYGSNEILEVFTTSGATGPGTDIGRTVSGIINAGNHSFAVSLYSNMAFGAGNQDILVQETPMDVLVWTPMLDQLRDTVVISNPAVVSGVVRTVKLSTAPNSSYRLLKNGVRCGWEMIVENGDIVQVEVDVPHERSKHIYVKVSSYNVDSIFHVSSEPVRKMNPVTFFPIYDVPPRAYVMSNVVEVSGLEPDVWSPVSVYNSEWVEWTLMINGVLQPNTPTELEDGTLTAPEFHVFNGDRLALYGIFRGQLNSIVEYDLLSVGEPVGSLEVNAVLIDGPEDWHNVYRSLSVSDAEAVGAWVSLKAHTLVDIPLPAQDFDKLTKTLTYGEQPRVPEHRVSHVALAPEFEDPISILRHTQTITLSDAQFESKTRKHMETTPTLEPVAGINRVLTTSSEMVSPEPYEREFHITDDGFVIERNSTSAAMEAPLPEYVRKVIPSLHFIDTVGKPLKLAHHNQISVPPAVKRNSFTSQKLAPVPRYDRSKFAVQRTKVQVFIKNKTQTPKPIAAQYTRSAFYEFRTPDDVFEIYARHTQLEVEGRYKIHHKFVQRAQNHGSTVGASPVTAYDPTYVMDQDVYILDETIRLIPTECVPYGEHPVREVDAAYERPATGDQRAADAVYERPATGDQRFADAEYERPETREQLGVDAVYDRGAEFGGREIDLDPEYIINVGSYQEIDQPQPYSDEFRDPAFTVTLDWNEQGLFETDEEALAYALSLGYPDATAVQVGDYYYSWFTPAKRQLADCSIVSNMFAIPYKWYVHGG